MIRYFLFVFCFALASLFYISCTKEESIITRQESADVDFEKDSGGLGMMARVIHQYGYDQIVVESGIHNALTNDSAQMQYKFHSTETELGDNIIKVSVYFPDIDSTFFLWSDPDSAVNKIRFRSAGGNYLSTFPSSSFIDLTNFIVYDDKNEQVGSDLQVDSLNSRLMKATLVSIVYTFAPEIIGEGINPVEPPSPVYVVTIRRGKTNAFLAAAAHCDPAICFQRDGYIRLGNIYIVWGSCTC